MITSGVCKRTGGLLIHNHELNTVTIHLARLKSFWQVKMSPLPAEIAEMRLKLIQLHEQEILTLENVFQPYEGKVFMNFASYQPYRPRLETAKSITGR